MTAVQTPAHQLSQRAKSVDDPSVNANRAEDRVAAMVFVVGSFLLSGLFFLFVLY